MPLDENADYQAVLDYLFAQLPMFQRMGAAALRKYDLSNTQKLMAHLGQPQEAYPCIHVGGTNGKGSTSHLLAAVLQAAGYKVGLYTSPHYRDFRERIKVNGAWIPKERVRDFVLRHRSAFEPWQLSFFELTVGLAFEHFRQEQVDVAIIEVGLGGRLDSTNILSQPLLSIITNIGQDHQDILGQTPERIAWEKAGIIKAQVPVLIGEEDASSRPVFFQKAVQMQAPLRFASRSYALRRLPEVSTWGWPLFEAEALQKGWPSFEALALGLTGSYQEKNLCTVLSAYAWLQELGCLPALNETALRHGLEHVQTATDMVGRWQVLDKNPLVIADGAHNAHGLVQIVKQLRNLPHRRLHWVFGVVRDKSLKDILPLMPKEASYYFCKADVPRGLPAAELQAQAQAHGLEGEAYESVAQAFAAAHRAAQTEDLVFVGGSIFVVGEVLTVMA